MSVGVAVLFGALLVCVVIVAAVMWLRHEVGTFHSKALREDRDQQLQRAARPSLRPTARTHNSGGATNSSGSVTRRHGSLSMVL